MSRFGNANWTVRPNFRPSRVPYGNLIPLVTHSPSERPNADFAPAAWLPIGDSSTNRSMGMFSYTEEPHGDYLVILAGKAVALTRENLGLTFDDGSLGRVVPAGVRIAWAGASGATNVIEYTSLDVSNGVMDVTTGAPVAAAVTYTKDQVTAGLIARGLLVSGESCEALISDCIGLAALSAYAWCGGDGVQPAGFRQHNYNRQDRVTVICDYTVKLPLVPSATLVTRDIPAIGTVVAAASEVASEAVSGDGAWATGAGGELASVLTLTARYGTIGTDWVALVLGAPAVEVTPTLPITITRSGSDITSTILKRRQASPADLGQDGDYYVDTALGIVFFYEAGGNALPAGMAAADIISISQNDSHTTYVSQFASAVGSAVIPGTFLVVDAMSNLRPYVARGAETQANNAGSADYVDPSGYDRPEDIVGQVLTLSRYPDEAMALTKTFYEADLGNGIKDRMPGSATEGYTDKLTYAGGGQFEVVINIMR